MVQYYFSFIKYININIKVESEKKHFDLAKFVADHQIPIKDKPRQDQDLVHTEDHGHNSPLSTVHSLTPQPPNLQGWIQ